MPRSSRPRAVLLALALAGAPALAQSPPQDANPVDVRGMLQVLRQLADQQSAAVKAAKLRAYQEAVSAAGNPAKAVELWEESVRITQFQGLAKDSSQFREWKMGEGEALKEKEVQGALRLYFNWLALTLQKSSGKTNHELFTAVMSHAQAAAADQAAMDAFNEALKKEKENIKDNAGKRPVSDHAKREKNTDEAVKKMHDQILGTGLSGSLYVQAMRLGEELADLAPDKKKRGGGAPTSSSVNNPDDGGWEAQPANVDGMYASILLPELRSRSDMRAIEYWEGKLRRETDNASRNRLTFEVEKFNQQRRPQLLWSRAHEFLLLGLKNRAATEMFAVIKAFPTNSDTPTWINELIALIAPPAPPAAPVTPAAAPPVAPGVGAAPAAP